TGQYLAAHSADTRFALGGPAAAADPSATPIVGTDRYATSAAIATQFFASPTVVGIADGLAFPDALSGGVHIGAQHGPMLLVLPPGRSATMVAFSEPIFSGSNITRSAIAPSATRPRPRIPNNRAGASVISCTARSRDSSLRPLSMSPMKRVV